MWRVVLPVPHAWGTALLAAVARVERSTRGTGYPTPPRVPARLPSRYSAAVGCFQRWLGARQCWWPCMAVARRSRAGPPKDGPKLGALFAPLGGLVIMSPIFTQ